MKKYRYDFMIIFLLLVFAGAGWLIINYLYNAKGESVEVIVGGKTIESFPLNENFEYTIETGEFVNVLKIEEGQVWIEDANCPDELCVKQGKISKDGQSIICLPHKTVIRINSDNEASVDAHTD